jgi:large subunit ribosomal protein L11
MAEKIVNALVEGGKAVPGPPLGPALAEAKVNVGQVVAAINEKTAAFKGMSVPVEITIDTVTKEFKIKVGTPPVSSLMKKELKAEKLARAAFGTYTPKEGETYVPFKGDLKFDQIIHIAKAKMDVLNTHIFKNAVKQIVGTCVSSGCTIEGKTPKEMIKEIEQGKWDAKIKE